MQYNMQQARKTKPRILPKLTPSDLGGASASLSASPSAEAAGPLLADSSDCLLTLLRSEATGIISRIFMS